MSGAEMLAQVMQIFQSINPRRCSQPYRIDRSGLMYTNRNRPLSPNTSGRPDFACSNLS